MAATWSGRGGEGRHRAMRSIRETAARPTAIPAAATTVATTECVNIAIPAANSKHMASASSAVTHSIPAIRTLRVRRDTGCSALGTLRPSMGKTFRVVPLREKRSEITTR